MSAALEQFEIGIRSRVPWDEYHELPGVSMSRLKEMRRSPQHYLHRLTTPKDTAPLRLGTAAHAAVLEPERFASQFAVWSRRSEETGNLCPRRGKYWDAFTAEHPGQTIITEDEHDLAVAIATAVRSSPAAMHYLASGEPEITMQWQMADGRRCRGRVDWVTCVAPPNLTGIRPHLVGLKSSRDCRHFRFGSQAAVLGYHLSWAFYYDGYRAITGVEPRVIEIVVESEAPHAVAVYSIPQDIIDQGRDEYQNLMLRLAECEATGHFPGPHEHEETLTLPSWVYGEAADDLTDLGLEAIQ